MTSAGLPVSMLRAQMGQIEREIRVQQQALEQAVTKPAQASTFQTDIAKLAYSLNNLKKQALKIKDPSLEEDIESLSADLNCLKTRVSILIKQNKLVVGASNAVLNHGAMPKAVDHAVGFLDLRETLRFTCANNTLQAAKENILKTKLHYIRRLNIDDLQAYAKALGRPGDREGVMALCQNLKRFEFESSKPIPISKVDLMPISFCIPKTVTSIDLRNTLANDDILLVLSKRLPELSDVNLSDCNGPYDDEYNGVTGNGLNLFLNTNCPFVSRLILDRIPNLDCSFEQFLCLAELSVVGTGLLLGNFTKSCKNLTHLTVSSREFASVNCWHAVAANCRKLQRLEIELLHHDAYHHAGCLDIVSSCPDLRHLALRDAIGLTSKHIIELVAAGPQLTTLDFRIPTDIGLFNTLLNSTAPITAPSVATWLMIADACPQILTKDLALGISNPTDEDVRAFTHKYKRVYALALNQADGLTDDGLAELTSGYTNLTQLNLACNNWNYHLTDQALQQLPQNCPRLQRIALHNCDFTFAGLDALLKGCPDLTEIRCQFSIEGLEEEELDQSLADKEKDFSKLREAYPRLKFHWFQHPATWKIKIPRNA